MSRSLAVRVAALCVLSLLLAAPWSAAEPREGHGPASSSALGQLWSRLTALWADIGCVFDPNGRCRDAVTSQSDIGCGMDPNGGCSH
jgi:hypothetical protein